MATNASFSITLETDTSIDEHKTDHKVSDFYPEKFTSLLMWSINSEEYPMYRLSHFQVLSPP